METKKKALGRGLEQLFSNEVIDISSLEKNILDTANKNDVVHKVNQFFSQNKNIELLWISLAEILKTITEIQIIDDNLSNFPLLHKATKSEPRNPPDNCAIV